MKLIIAVAALLAVAYAAAPPPSYKDAQIVSYDNDNDNIEGYNYGFKTSDGTSKQESAVVENLGTDHEALKVSGSFSYIQPDTGKTYEVSYTADENGFQITGTSEK